MCIRDRPGPACVVMRSSSIGGEVDVESPPFIHSTTGYLNTAKPQSAPQDIEKAIEILREAKKPILVAGNGVHLSKSHTQLQQLAELWDMPVATSYKGKSAIAETHPLSVGMVGVYGQAAANSAVGDSDVVVIVGAKLSPQDTVRERPDVFDPHRQKIIQIDIDDRNAGWTFPVDLGLIGDAGSILSQLIEASPEKASESAQGRQEWAQGLALRKETQQFYLDPAMSVDSSPITPQRAVSILHDNLPEDTVFALDAGNNRTWMAHLYQARQSNTFFSPGGTAGMGWGLPASVALKLVYPDRPVVCVTGDGGYMMTVSAISTAVQYQIPMICVVFNDNSLGMVRQHQPEDKRIASEFVESDNSAIAKAMGAFGLQIKDSRDLPNALREAQNSGLPAVIDILIDRAPSPDDWRADLRTAGET